MSGAANRYVVAGNRTWVRAMFERDLATLPGQWFFAACSEDLTVEKLRDINPRYIFFVHWSDRVPAEIHDAYECICFHMTDVPYGRGGSPLQNLIVRGHTETKLAALRMVEAYDAGPIYMKESLSLAGTAQEIYERACHVAAGMIRRLISAPVEPRPQQGEVVCFRRRTPEESALPLSGDLSSLHDHIRMLDAAGYPHAFLKHGDFLLEFRGSELRGDHLEARVVVKRAPKQP